ncbi:hypothetical protein OPQ81_007610 [Rhizoctonia solani]|nr:hypothetical protein OPQ81_007610 [Rhizoctonia solani]
MNVPSVPKRPLKLHTGSDQDHIPLPMIFARRLEVIVPTHGPHEARLGAQVARHAITSGVRLADVLSAYTAEEAGTETSMSMSAQDEEGAWLIDRQQGLLVMKITKERYRALGIAGKETDGAYTIQVDLKDKTTKLYSRARDALEGWEKTWDVWTTEDANVSERPMTKLPHTIKKVEPETILLKDVLVPTRLPLEDDEDESWAELFEWVGMCTIGKRGSPRIATVNQINPYISGYLAPEGSKTGSVTRFRWEGPLSHKFIRDTVRMAREGAETGLVAFSISAFNHGNGLWLKLYGRRDVWPDNRDTCCVTSSGRLSRKNEFGCSWVISDRRERGQNRRKKATDDHELGHAKMLSRVLEVIARKVAADAAYRNQSCEYAMQSVTGPAGRILGGARVWKWNERHVAVWLCLSDVQSPLEALEYPVPSVLNGAYTCICFACILDLHAAWSPVVHLSEFRRLFPPPLDLLMAQYIPGSSVTISASLSALSHQPVADDAHVVSNVPRVCVDYLSHNWQEEDVWKSWRNMTRHKHEIANGIRLENASWRTWWKQRNKLRTVSPETLNWLKDSDVTWLYGPLHTAEPVPPHKEPTLSDKLDLIKSAGKKPILKHRTLTELLSLPRPSSPILESSDLADDEALEYDNDGNRPPLLHTKSDTNIIRRPSNRRVSPPRVVQGMGGISGQQNPVPTLQVNGLEKTRSRGSESSNSPRGGSSDIESNSGKERRHIHFNKFVEQCISIDKPRSAGGDDESEEDEVDDDILEMRSISGSSTTSVVSSTRPSFSRRDSNDKDLISIAPIAPTILKSSDPHPAPSPAVVFVPPSGYEGEHALQYQAQQQNNEHYTPPPVNGVGYASPCSVSSSTSSHSNWEDEDEDYGVGFDYFGGPDLGIGQEYDTRSNSRGNSYVGRGAQRDQPSSVSSDISTTPTQRDSQLARSVAAALAGGRDREDEFATSSNSSNQSDSTVQAPAQRSSLVTNDAGSGAPASYRGSYDLPPDSAYLSPTDLRGRSLSPGGEERGRSNVRTPPAIEERERSSSRGTSSPIGSVSPNSSRPGSALGRRRTERGSTGEDASRTVPIGVVANAIGAARPSLVIHHSPVSKEDVTSCSLEEGISGAELERRRDDFWADSTDYAPPPPITQPASKSAPQEKPRKAADDQAHAQDEVDDGGSQYSYMMKGDNPPANKTPANSPVMHRSRPLPAEGDMASRLPHVSTPLPPTPPQAAASATLAQNKAGEHVEDPTLVGRAVDIVHSAKGWSPSYIILLKR